MNWQPIETAPKDRWILLYSPSLPNERFVGQMYVARWEPLSYNWPAQWAYGEADREHGFRSGVYGATHWAPLPDPPQ